MDDDNPRRRREYGREGALSGECEIRAVLPSKRSVRMLIASAPCDPSGVRRDGAPTVGAIAVVSSVVLRRMRSLRRMSGLFSPFISSKPSAEGLAMCAAVRRHVNDAFGPSMRIGGREVIFRLMPPFRNASRAS